MPHAFKVWHHCIYLKEKKKEEKEDHFNHLFSPGVGEETPK